MEARLSACNKAIGAEGYQVAGGRITEEKTPHSENRRKLLKKVLGWILIAVGVLTVFLGFLSMTSSPLFSPEEMDRIEKQVFTLLLIGLSLVLSGGVIVFRCRKG